MCAPSGYLAHVFGKFDRQVGMQYSAWILGLVKSCPVCPRYLGKASKIKINKERDTHLYVYIYINLFSLIIYIGMWDGYVLNASIHAGCR
jgi:hypothetical protein